MSSFSAITRSVDMRKQKLSDMARQGMDAVTRAGDLARETGAQVSASSETLRDIAAGARQQIADLAGDVQQVSATKFEQVMVDIDTALPLFRQAGYVLEGLRIQLGLIPQLHADFRAGADVSDEQVEKMLAAHADRELTSIMIRAMRHASKLQTKLTFGGLRPDGLSVTVGVPPGVAVKFSPIDRRNVRAHIVPPSDPPAIVLPAPPPGTPPA